MSKKLYLYIAGFNLQVEFNEIEAPHRRSTLINLINLRYKGFLKKKADKIDFTIIFEPQQKLKSLNSEDGTTLFINLYIQKDKRILTTFYHISLFQFDLIITHTLQKLLSENSGFFIHTSAVLIDNKAYLFLGRSGDGKSTSAQLLNKYYSILSDDGAIIKSEHNSWYLYQTPFMEKNQTMTKTSKKYNLGKMFFLKKSEFFQIVKLSNKSIIAEKLLAQLYSQQEDVETQFKNLMKFVNNFDIFYQLHFQKKSSGMKKIIHSII